METMSIPKIDHVKELAPPADLSHHFSRATKNRVASRIKDFYKYFSIPGIGNLAGGLPNSHYFPYDTLEASTALPNRFKPTPNDTVDLPKDVSASCSSSDDPSASRVLVPHDSTEANILRKIDLTTALQYGTTQGYPPLYTFLRQFTLENLHPNIPYKDGPEIILTCGSTDGFSKSLEAFSNVWDQERDWIREREGLLCEEFAYMNAIQTARPRGLKIVTVVVDDEGMTASGNGGLAEVLKNWDISKGKRPHLMYTVTVGQNPTSGLLSLQRRKEIYALCHQYDIIIIEDDPYWHLQYPSANVLSGALPPNHNYNATGRSSGFPFLDSLVPSYLSIDTDGRVVRLDTFSKSVAPGCRLGWITAQPAIVEKLLRITETSTQQPSGFVQSMIAELIIGPHDPSDGGKGGANDGSGWKVDGWVRWLEGLRGNYERRMQKMASILDEGKYAVSASHATDSEDGDAVDGEYALVSKRQMYSFVMPLAGMFLWMRLHYFSHPLYSKTPHERLARALWIFLTSEPYHVLVSPGGIFSPTEELRQEKGWQYFRLCFAAVDDEVLATFSRDFVEGCQKFWGFTKVAEIDDILRDDEMLPVERMELEAVPEGWAFSPLMC